MKISFHRFKIKVEHDHIEHGEYMEIKTVEPPAVFVITAMDDAFESEGMGSVIESLYSELMKYYDCE